jgi:hypothetical protein
MIVLKLEMKLFSILDLFLKQNAITSKEHNKLDSEWC